MKMSKWIYSYLGSNFVFSYKVEVEIKRWEKVGRDILTLYSSLLLDANIFRKFQWHSKLAWEIYMKSKFILYTGHKIKGQKAMNGNNKIWTGGTAPETLRKNKLIKKQSWDPILFFRIVNLATRLRTLSSQTCHKPSLPILFSIFNSLLNQSSYFVQLFPWELPPRFSAPSHHQYSGSENASIAPILPIE